MGYHLKYDNVTSTTTLGYDASGNNRHHGTYNMSVDLDRTGTQTQSTTWYGAAQTNTGSSRAIGTSGSCGKGIDLNGTDNWNSLPINGYYNPGTGPFCIEGFVNIEQGSANGLTFFTGTSNGSLNIRTSNSNPFTWNVERINVAFDLTDNGGNLSSGWNHWAITRDSSDKLRMYLDGDMVASQANNTTNYFFSGSEIRMGRLYEQSTYSDAWFSNFRIVVGEPVYTSDSSLTIPTSCFPSDGSDLDTAANLRFLTFQWGAGASHAAQVDRFDTTNTCIDVPTDWGADDNTGTGAQVRGNYCQLDSQSAHGDLQVESGGTRLSGNSSGKSVLGTIFPTSGKWYFEYRAKLIKLIVELVYVLKM